MFQDAVRVPASDSSLQALAHMHRRGITNTPRVNSSTGSGFGKDKYQCVNRKMVYPDNVLKLPTETRKLNHSAPFPEGLPEWFILLFTEERDTVLDPFMGSGTTVIVANRLNRKAIGVEIQDTYFEHVQEEIKNQRNAKEHIIELKDETGEVKIYRETRLFDG